MKTLKDIIQEKLIINKNIKNDIIRIENVNDELKNLSYLMFNKYSSSYGYNELSNWVKNGLEPDESDYQEFIEDILEYCEEENTKISKELYKLLNNYDILQDEVQEKIKLQILNGMEKLYNEIF